MPDPQYQGLPGGSLALRVEVEGGSREWAGPNMRWGICFLLWVCSGIYFVDSCLDYVRVWQHPPRGFTREMVLPHLKACGTERGLQFAGVTAGLVGLYYGTGWLQRRRAGSGRRP